MIMDRGEAENFGQCPMRIDHEAKIADPGTARRGDVARTSFAREVQSKDRRARIGVWGGERPTPKDRFRGTSRPSRGAEGRYRRPLGETTCGHHFVGVCVRELRQLRGRRASEPHKPARSARGNRACRAWFLRHKNGIRLRRDLLTATGRPARRFVAVRPEESAWV